MWGEILAVTWIYIICKVNLLCDAPHCLVMRKLAEFTISRLQVNELCIILHEQVDLSDQRVPTYRYQIIYVENADLNLLC